MPAHLSPLGQLVEIAQLPQDRIFQALDIRIEGLHPDEVHRKLRTDGLNVISTQPKTHLLLQYFTHYRDPLALVLVLVSLISFLMGEVFDGTIVLVMIFLSSTLNFLQEYKASRAAEKLRSHLASKSMVWRNGKLEEVSSSHVCRGDIIELNAGDLIPADCRIITANDCYVNQSSLTGESLPVVKTDKVSAKTCTDLSDLQNILFAGTSLVTGTAKAVVLLTGSSTQFGSIAQTLTGKDDGNAFINGTKRLSILIVRIITIFVVFIFVASALLNGNLWQSLAFSVAVAVGLTPEFLPMILSVAMGNGSLTMAKKGVIIKQLTAIPNLGSMDVLCTDKTGTLTQDKIKLVRCVDIEGKDSATVLFHAYLNSYFQSGLTNPMDEAVLKFKKVPIRHYRKTDEIPFDFVRKRMSVVVKHQDSSYIITKGAPEEVLSVCTGISKAGTIRHLTVKDRLQFHKQYDELSRSGFRVLAVAYKEVDNQQQEFSTKDETHLCLLGFTAFLDPAKPDARSALEELEKLGVEVKVITGDNELVASTICKEVDINVKGMMMGHETEELSDKELGIKAEQTTLFARVSPTQKNRIIQALRNRGHVVGYMGDGINDAPSLQSADVGISVSNAVDVAKQSADVILTHKNLHLLKVGVIEGRKTFGNTIKYVIMGLSSNFGNMFSVLGAVLFLPFLPMLPIQILLNNFLYDLSQLTIPSDHVDEEYVSQPQKWDLGFIRKFVLTLGPVSSLFDFITFALLYVLYKHQPSAFQTGWFMTSLATQVLVIYVIRTRKLPFIQSRPSAWLLASTILTVCFAWLIPRLPLGSYFDLVPIPVSVMVVLGSIVVLYLIFTESVKKYFYLRYRPAPLKQ